MPRLNDVFLVGYVADAASVKKDKEGNYIQAALPITVIHGRRTQSAVIKSYYSGADVRNGGKDLVWIFTSNEEMCRSFEQCKILDIVEVKGVVRVMRQKRKAKCPECGQPHIFYTNRLTVYPIHFKRRRSYALERGLPNDIDAIDAKTLEEVQGCAEREVVSCIEISNTVRLIGVIAKEPLLYKQTKTGMYVLTFPLAVKRKYFIPEDTTDDNVDFPLIKIYGPEAERQSKILRAANLILIDGYIQSRDIYRNYPCETEECSKANIRISVEDVMSNVIPYSIEYVRANISDTEFAERAEDEPTNKIPQYIGSDIDANLLDGSIEDSFEIRLSETNEADAAVQKALDSIKDDDESEDDEG